MFEPCQNTFGRKRKLADDINAQAVRSSGSDLFIECGFKTPGWNARMAFRISADTDLFNPGFTQSALLNYGESIGEYARCVDIPADQ